MRKLCIMFDLENTIIDSWHSGCVLHSKIHTIQDTLSDIHKRIYNTITYGIFSFAVDNDDEKPIAKKFLFDALGFVVDDDNFCPSFLDMELVCRSNVLQKWELINIYGKDLLFPMWAYQYPDYNFILFDDSLPSKYTSILRDIDGINQTITLIRV